MIALVDVDKLAQQIAAYHHPHYQGVSKNEYNTVSFRFKAFTGAESAPRESGSVWDTDLSRGAQALLRAEYDEAHRLWRDAHYVRTLKATVADASTLWDTCVQSRKVMDAAFANLKDTPDTRWRSAVSTLVTAQDETLAAARLWDATAEQVACIHEAHFDSDLSRREAFTQAGIDASGWVIGSQHEYQGRRTPLVRQVSEAIDKQREHLQQVASLTGIRS